MRPLDRRRQRGAGYAGWEGDQLSEDFTGSIARWLGSYPDGYAAYVIGATFETNDVREP